MTEYDYSEEAYTAFLKHQEGVGRWCANVSKYQSQFQDPFRQTPSESGRKTETNIQTKGMKPDSGGGKVTRKLSSSRRSSISNSTAALPGPAPVADYRRMRSMSVSNSPPQAQYPAMYPPNTSHHHHHHHHHHRRSRSSSRGPESRVMYYAAGGPGPTPYAPQPQYVHPVVQTRGAPLAIVTPNMRYETRQPKRGQSFDYAENSRHNSPTKINRKSSYDSPTKQDSPNSLLKRVFGTLRGNSPPDQPRPKTSHEHKRSQPIPQPERRKRRTSFF